MSSPETPGLNAEGVTVYTTQPCPYCQRAKELLKRRGVPFTEKLVLYSDEAEWDRLYELTGFKTMPQIFHGSRFIGGYSELVEADREDALQRLLG